MSGEVGYVENLNLIQLPVAALGGERLPGHLVSHREAGSRNVRPVTPHLAVLGFGREDSPSSADRPVDSMACRRVAVLGGRWMPTPGGLGGTPLMLPAAAGTVRGNTSFVMA